MYGNEKHASEDKTFRFYPGATHCLTTDPEAADMRETVRKWMEAH